MKLLFLLCLILPSIAMAISEGDLKVEWKKSILPHFALLKTGTFKNGQGMNIAYFYSRKTGNHRSLVILPGRTEPAIKYAELIYDLKDSGLNIYIMDHQGQGASDRLLADSHKGHVISFKNYVADFAQFNKEVVDVKESGTRYLIAHSMGGAIATLYMKDHQKTFAKAVLSSPMFKVNSKPYSESVGRFISGLLTKVGKGDDYAPGKSLYFGPYIAKNNRFEKNTLTRSEARFDYFKDLFTTQPSLIVNGPTARWAHEAIVATKHIDQIMLETPVLLLQAQKDQIVMLDRQDSFCEKGNCEKIKFQGASHEILMEKDETREEALKEIKLFFSI